MNTATGTTQSGDPKLKAERETTPIKLCTKCNDNAATDTHQWCNSCKATYQREYMQTIKKLNTEQSHARGVQQLRSFLILEFERLGSGAFTGYEIAELIRQAQLRD